MSGTFLVDDLSVFFNTDEFADSAVFDGSSVPVVGILDKAFDLAQIGDVEVQSTAPVFVLPAGSVPGGAQGRYLRFGNLLAGGTRWRVVSVRPAIDSVAILILEEA